RLDREAEELRRRFDEAFWVESRGGYYALALDAEKRQVDSLCSNIGHLLWSGIVPPHRVDAVVDQLMGDELWSGWGVRTMSTGDAGYNPLSYHNGTGSRALRRRNCLPGRERSGCPASAPSAASGTRGSRTAPCGSTRHDGSTGRTVKIAILAPAWFAVPPTGYGGIEWIVSLLADG